MKVLKYVAITAIAGFMASCTNEAMVEDVQTSGLNVTTRSIIDPVGIQEVAELMSIVDIDDAIMQEVKAGIERSVKYGMGKTYRFNDIFKPEESKLVRTLEIIHSLSDELRKAYADIKSTGRMTLSDSDFFTTLANGNLMVRWPYFQNWNGVDKPTIGFASEDELSLYVPGQKQDGSFSMDTIIYSEDYVKNNPVWVIAESDLSYDEIPDFENDEFFNKDSTFFYSKYAIEKLNSKLARTGMKGLYIVNMKFLERYEAGSKDGEFEFYWQSVPNGIGESKKIMRYVVSEELDGEELQVNLCIKSNWDINELDNGLVILEKDGGVNKTGIQTLRYDAYSFTPKRIDVSYPYEKRDEQVLNHIWGRSVLCSEEENTAVDGSLKKYYGKDDHFWITFKYFE